MLLERIYLKHFRNFDETEIVFKEELIAFVGNNGSGKTNLLDAIHYLCLCRSYFNPIDYQNIQHGKEHFDMQGVFIKKEVRETVTAKIQKNHPKIFKRNNKQYARLSEHIGLFPLAIIAPIDLSLITEGSEERRKFIDHTIIQYDRVYLNDLLSYNKVLSQRNALLKQFAEKRTFDNSLLTALDEQLIPLGNKIYKKRAAFIKNFIPVFQEYYDNISGRQETVDCIYESKLKDKDLKQLLHDALAKDRILQRTTEGIHKDDFMFLIGDYPIKRFGSQGQQKSFVFALKLAKYIVLKNNTAIKPILLLDDIFDRLDRQRIENLLSMILGDEFGQIFFTDTRIERVEDILYKKAGSFKIHRIEHGKIM